MGRTVKWTETALKDLIEYLDVLDSNSLSDSRELRKQIMDDTRGLQDCLLKGEMLSDYGNPTHRELLVGPFRIIYALGEPSTIYVMAVVHSG